MVAAQEMYKIYEVPAKADGGGGKASDYTFFVRQRGKSMKILV